MLSRNTMSVGIERTLKNDASSGWASVSTLPKTRSGCASDAASKVGPNIRHGPHHAAQKSTSTVSLPVIVDSKLSLVSSTVATRGASLCDGGDRKSTHLN